MKQPVPDVTKSLGVDFWWDTQKLWAVDLPIEEMPIKKFEWMFELPLWDWDNKQLQLKPIDVKNNPEKYKEQLERTMNANLQYPVVAIYLKRRWVVMDGLHRVMKSHLLANKTIMVKKVYKKDIPLIEMS